MRVVAAFFTALYAAGLVNARARTADIYILPIATTGPPSHLAEVSYDTAALSSSSVVSWEAPEIHESTKLVRIGLWDSTAKSWIAGTTVASVENFDKGYSPTLMLSVDAKGDVQSVALKGVRIDAGQTRDFGPKAMVLLEAQGKQPELNKPVVLTPEGKKPGQEEEKTFLQKYWWMIAIAVMIGLSGGGGPEK
ncbi:hypothetical protein HJFPF1_00463 [Paramyrothecium foliicola]|nr:hypothetical protein HJFPF1_00463 [Paramyrothecium foliicola]